VAAPKKCKDRRTRRCTEWRPRHALCKLRAPWRAAIGELIVRRQLETRSGFESSMKVTARLRKALACLVVAGTVAALVSLSERRAQPLIARCVGATNDYYTAFFVTNRMRKTVVYASGELQLRTEAGWQKASGRFRHIPSQLINGTSTGTVLVATPKGADPWRARLVFESIETNRWKYFLHDFCRTRLGLAVGRYSVISDEITK
jgi:hypothetical protein